MKLSRIQLVILLIVCVAIIVPLWRERIRIAVWYWHLRHSTITVNGYVVPVPKNWYADKESDNNYLLMRLDTSDTAPIKRMKVHAVIGIEADKLPRTQSDVQRTAEMQTSWLKQHGVRNVTWSMKVGDGTLVCIGRGSLYGGGFIDMDPETWACQAPSGLQMQIVATPPDMKQIWEILSGIRRQ